MEISEDQVTVFSGLENIKLKILIVKVYLGILIALTIVLILLMTCIKSVWQDKAILAAVEIVLGYTIKPMTSHFFPPYLKGAKK